MIDSPYNCVSTHHGDSSIPSKHSTGEVECCDDTYHTQGVPLLHKGMTWTCSINKYRLHYFLFIFMWNKNLVFDLHQILWLSVTANKILYSTTGRTWIRISEKIFLRSEILKHPSIGEYWNISSVPVLPENVILAFFTMWWWDPEANNTGMQKWSSIVQYSCTSIWDL